MLKSLLVAAIRVYQRAISPMKWPSCRYYPSCSEYFIQALEKRGVVIGFLLGIWRIVRCNPLCRGGYDPVPEKRGKSG